jgi:hypothetical protein
MRRVQLLALVLTAAASVLGACTSEQAASPDTTVPKVMQSAPNVTGVLEVGGVNGARFRLVEVFDPYFDRGSIEIDARDPVVVSASGEPISEDSLIGGMRVEVWVGGCAESHPVQCIAEAIRIVEP